MIRLAIVLFATLLLNSCSLLKPKFKGHSVNIESAKSITWFNTQRALTNKDLKGKIVILYFWHFGDEAQMQTLSALKEVSEHFPDELLVIAVNVPLLAYEKSPEALRNFALKYAVNFPVVHDVAGELAEVHGIMANPAMMFIDPKTEVFAQLIEMPSAEDLMIKVQSWTQNYQKKKQLDLSAKSLVLPEREKIKINQNIDEMNATLEEDLDEPVKQDQLFFPSGIAWSDEMELLAIADTANHQIKIINKYSKLIETIGSGVPGKRDGNFTEANFNYPEALVFDDMTLVVLDKGNDLFRLINLNDKNVQTLDTTLYNGYSAVCNFANGFLLGTKKGQLLKYDRERMKVQLDKFLSVTGLLYARDVHKEKKIKAVFVSDAKAASVYAYGRNEVEKLDWNGVALSYPQGLAYYSGNLYVADTYSNQVKVFDLMENKVRDLVIKLDNCNGDTCESFFEPADVKQANFAFEKVLFVADSANHRIVKFSLDTGKAEIFY